jgi:putative heme iron utilization protein
LTDEEKARVNQIRGMIPQMKAEQVKGFIERIDQQAASAPADKQNAIKAIRKLLEDRLKQLEGGKQ